MIPLPILYVFLRLSLASVGGNTASRDGEYYGEHLSQVIFNEERVLTYFESNDLFGLIAGMRARNAQAVPLSPTESAALRVAYFWFRMEQFSIASQVGSGVDWYAPGFDADLDDEVLPARSMELFAPGADESMFILKLNPQLFLLAGKFVGILHSLVSCTMTGYITESYFKSVALRGMEAMRAFVLAGIDRVNSGRMDEFLSRADGVVAPLLMLRQCSGWTQQPKEWARIFQAEISQVREMMASSGEDRLVELGKYFLASGRLNAREELQRILLAEFTSRSEEKSKAEVQLKAELESKAEDQSKAEVQSKPEVQSTDEVQSKDVDQSNDETQSGVGTEMIRAETKNYVYPTDEEVEIALFLDYSLVYSAMLAKLYHAVRRIPDARDLLKTEARLARARKDLGKFGLKRIKRTRLKGLENGPDPSARSEFSTAGEGSSPHGIDPMLDSVQGTDSSLGSETSSHDGQSSRLDRVDIGRTPHPDILSPVQSTTPSIDSSPFPARAVKPPWLQPLIDRLAFYVKGTMYGILASVDLGTITLPCAAQTITDMSALLIKLGPSHSAERLDIIQRAHAATGLRIAYDHSKTQKKKTEN